MAGDHDACLDYGTPLGDGIRLVVDAATRIDTASRTVELASGPGAGLRLRHQRGRQHGRHPSSVPGASEYACSLARPPRSRRSSARRR
ncbi:hypothetical protein ACU635_32285 [[Actinomadura] parvosata]|uniref:hypothetical protein n=1 Tax=[Actinomadura] parvosata TaxID=1955412 RepID=UPI00406D0ABA